VSQEDKFRTKSFAEAFTLQIVETLRKSSFVDLKADVGPDCFLARPAIDLKYPRAQNLCP
jgi:hypothetical protein